MSKKEPSLFEIVMNAFGGWSPGGLAVRGRRITIADKDGIVRERDRFVLLLESRNVRHIPGWKGIVRDLNTHHLPGVDEVRIVDRIELR